MDWYWMLFYPFAMVGFYQVATILSDKIKIRKGYYRVIFRTSNFRKIKKLIKPDKESIKVGERIYPFSNSMGFVYFDGTTPEIEYDTNDNQINFNKEGTTSTIDPIAMGLLAKRTYNRGKAKTRKNENIIMVISLVAAGASVLAVMLLWGMMA